MRITYAQLGPNLLATPSGSLGAYNANHMRLELLAHADLQKNWHLVLDLNAVTKFDYFGAETLVAIGHAVRAHKGGYLRVFNLHKSLMEMLNTILGHSVCECFRTLEEALAGLHRTDVPAAADNVLQSMSNTCSIDCQRILRETDFSLAAFKALALAKNQKSDRLQLPHATVWWCTGGRVRIHGLESVTVDLTQGEVVILYGGIHFCAEGLADATTLNGWHFGGLQDEDVLNELGFFNGLTCQSEYPANTSTELQDMIATGLDPVTWRQVSLPLVWERLTSLIAEARAQGDLQFFDAIRLINRNYLHRIVRLQPVYTAMGMSRSNFNEVFRRNGVLPPGNYILNLQLRHARRLLANQNLSIADIAFRCGFRNANHFATFFKRHTGQRPIDTRHNVK